MLTHWLVQVCLFYLVLRGLDTIEDDMTLPDEKKQPVLRQFHKLAVEPAWTFDECGPNEKDRQLLVEWTVVSEELNRLDAWCVCPSHTSTPQWQARLTVCADVPLRQLSRYHYRHC